MKVSINIDLTPLEARQFMGLPDVEPMQKAAMASLEQKIKEQMDRFSAEGLVDMWVRGGPELFKTMMDGMLGAGRAANSAKTK